MTAHAITIAEEIKDEIADMELSETVVPERVYVHEERLQSIGSDLKVWVQPTEYEVTALSRIKDQARVTIDVGILKRCVTDAEVDDIIGLADEVFLGLRRLELDSGAKVANVERPVLVSPDGFMERNLFAAVISVVVLDEIGE